MFKDRVIRGSEVSLYSMPSLEEERTAGRNEDGMQRTEDIQREAYEEGFSSGEKAGFAEGEHKAALLIEGMENIVKEIASVRENLVKELEGQVVDLATMMAQKIVAAEISLNQGLIANIVREALKKLERTGTITIRINPALYELFMKKKSELEHIHKDIIFDVNPGVSLTGPHVISRTEEVITDIDALFENIMEDLQEVRTGSTGERADVSDAGRQEYEGTPDIIPADRNGQGS